MDTFPPWFKLEMGDDKTRLGACKLRKKIMDNMEDILRKGFVSIYCSESDYSNRIIRKITEEVQERGFSVKVIGYGSLRKMIISNGKSNPISELGLCKQCWKKRSIDEYYDERNCIYCKVINPVE